MKSQPFTKAEIAEFMLRLYIGIQERTRVRMMNHFEQMSDISFLKEARKVTDLFICSFAPNMYIIKYQ